MKPEAHEDANKAAVSPIVLSTISTMANFTNRQRPMWQWFHFPSDTRQHTMGYDGTVLRPAERHHNMICLFERFENVSKICVTLHIELISYADFKHSIAMDQN